MVEEFEIACVRGVRADVGPEGGGREVDRSRVRRSSVTPRLHAAPLSLSALNVFAMFAINSAKARS